MKNLSVLAAPAFVLLVACGGSTPPAGAPSTTSPTAAKVEPKKDKSPICYEVHETCEPFEGKGGPAQECHDMTYSATEEQCVAKKTECLAACKK